MYKNLRKKLQSNGASWFRVCYQRGLPRLVPFQISNCLLANLRSAAPVLQEAWDREAEVQAGLQPLH